VVIIRRRDFPLRLHSQKVIFLHWLTVLILCPLGYFSPFFAILAVLAYIRMLYIMLFNEGQVDRTFISAEDRALN